MPYCSGGSWYSLIVSCCLIQQHSCHRRLMRLLFYFVRRLLWTFVTSHHYKPCYFLFLSPFTRHWPAVPDFPTAGLFNIPVLRHVTPCSWHRGVRSLEGPQCLGLQDIIRNVEKPLSKNTASHPIRLEFSNVGQIHRRAFGTKLSNWNKLENVTAA